MKNKILFLLLPLIGLFAGSVFAQDGPAAWFEVGVSKKITKDLKFEMNPELRLLGDHQIDTYILEGGLSYKLHKYLTVAGYYRYENEYDYKKSTGAYKGQQSLNRLAFDAKTGADLKRFDFQFRLRYTRGIDPVVTTADKASYFRYRAKVEYNIKGSKIVPSVSLEVFHDLIISRLDKIRYTGGLAYPINKNNDIELFYRLQDYLEASDYIGVKKESLHIIGLSYSLKF